MANDRLTLARTDARNLLANLRGEVGEAITTWLLMRNFILAGPKLQSDDPAKDITNKQYRFQHLMADKLCDDLVGRLSELADRKIGRLNFYFATQKIERFSDDAIAFEKYIIGTKIREKRNRDISHKELAGLKPQQRALDISYRTLLRAVARALRLMKRIDRHVLGPSGPFLWAEARKKRYDFLSPPRAGYMLIPYLNLSPEKRAQIVRMELAEGRTALTKIHTMIDGQATTVLACKPWGVIVLGDRLFPLGTYPLIKLDSISLT